MTLREFLSRHGAVGAAILEKDWARTSLGPIESWPQSLVSTLRLALSSRQAMIFFWGPDLLQFFNEAYAPTVDGMAPNPIGAPFKVYWAEVFEGVRPYYERAIAGEGTWEEDLHLRLTRDGITEDTYWTFSYSPLFDDDGAIAGFMNVVHETSRGVRARLTTDVANEALQRIVARQTALIELGDRLRHATDLEQISAISGEIVARELAPDRVGYAIVDMNAATWDVRAEWTAPGVASLAGKHSLAAFAETASRLARGLPLADDDTALATWIDRDREGYSAIGLRAQIQSPMMTGGRLVGTFYVHSGTPRHWSADEIAFVQNVSDRVYGASVRVALEEQRNLLTHEISHRLKNTLSMVQAIARQTLRQVPERSLVDTFDKRLQALSQAHDTLMQSSWAGASLAEMAGAVLSVIAPEERFQISGPDIVLNANSALSLSLILHELGTNAVKYGALSSPEGRVVLTWSVDAANEQERRFRLVWKEQGGPPPVAPKSKGFGSRLIAAGLGSSGSVDVAYERQGVSVILTAPLAQIQAPVSGLPELS